MAQPRRVRGNIERLPSGHYRASVYAGTDPLTGRERRLKRTAKRRRDHPQDEQDENTVGLRAADVVITIGLLRRLPGLPGPVTAVGLDLIRYGSESVES